jgi:hypothetical protein
VFFVAEVAYSRAAEAEAQARFFALLKALLALAANATVPRPGGQSTVRTSPEECRTMTLPSWLERTGLLAACLVVPIVWGWLTNWLFGRWSSRRHQPRKTSCCPRQSHADHHEFIDYSI